MPDIQIVTTQAPRCDCCGYPMTTLALLPFPEEHDEHGYKEFKRRYRLCVICARRVLAMLQESGIHGMGDPFTGYQEEVAQRT